MAGIIHTMKTDFFVHETSQYEDVDTYIYL